MRNGRTMTTAEALRPGLGAAARKRRTVAILRGVAGVLILVVVIEIVSRAGIVNEAFLPPFTVVIGQMFELFTVPEFLMDIVLTVGAWALGLGLATIVAVPVGVALGLSDTAYSASRTLIELLRPMPAIALIPLVLLLLGPTLQMKLVVAVYAAFWPILFNTIYGVRGVDVKAKEMARSFGLSKRAITWRVVVPGAAPFIATGIRLSSSIVLIIVITIELVAGGNDGLGAFIATARAVNQVPDVYAGILVTGILGLLINIGLGSAERRWLGWDATTRTDS